MTGLRERALFAYVFAPVEAGVEAIADGWRAVRRLGITAPIEDLDVGPNPVVAEFPAEPVPSFRLLAAATRPGERGQFQAYAFAQHDTAGVMACLMPEDDAGDRWKALLAEWDAALGASAANRELGRVVVLVGLVAAGDGGGTGPAELDGRPWVSGLRTERQFAVWQATGEPRLMALLGTEEREEEVHRWAWWEGETRLPSLPRYLLHAAKLRFEQRVYQAEMPEFHRAQQTTEDELVAVTALLADADSRPQTAERLLEAERRLIGLEASLAGVAGSTTDLKDLRRTVAIATENMRPLIPAPARGERGDASPFADDLELAGWLERQIDHDIGYASSTRERLDRVRDLLQMRLRHASERRAQEQEYLLLLQTALLSALIAGGGTYAALKESSLESFLYLPYTAMAVTLALALPLLFIHWYARYRWVDRIAAGLVGASFGWLIATWAWPHDGGGADPLLAFPLAIAGGVAFVALTFVQDAWVRQPRG